MFRNVRTYRRAVDGGVEVTFEVFELPMIRHLQFVGNKGIKDKALKKEAELKVGEPLQRFRVEEARRKLQELYQQKGLRRGARGDPGRYRTGRRRRRVLDL